MIILKIILCSSLFISLYYLFLQKEKMYLFNRFFLIFSLIFSCFVPFISISTDFPKQMEKTQIIFEETQQALVISSKQESFNWINIVWIIYGIITFIFLTKTIMSIVKIKNIKGKKIKYLNCNVIVTKENLSPFSFWKTIYLGENYLINNEIDSRILLHEKSHLEQKHSLDLLLIEILKIFLWFNPSIYFYKKAIVTNHEFLADESVLKLNFNIKDYQKLILEEITSNQNYNLTHTLNFNNTKKRFIMMTRKKSKFVQVKKYFAIPTFIVLAIIFAEKTYAKDSNTESTVSETIKSQKVIPDQSLNKIQSEHIEKEQYKNTVDKKKVLNTTRKTVDTQLTESKSTITNPDKKPVQDVAISTPVKLTQENTTMPEYPGGLNVMRNKVSQNFNGSVLKGDEGLIRSDVQFVIDEKGEVSNIKTMGSNEIFNNEAYKAVKLANENITWKPATKDGQPVKYIFKLPLTMVFAPGKKTQ